MNDKVWWKSKTMWLNGAATVVAGAEYLVGVLPPSVAPQFYVALTTALPIANMLLRAVTTKGVTLTNSK